MRRGSRERGGGRKEGREGGERGRGFKSHHPPAFLMFLHDPKKGGGVRRVGWGFKRARREGRRGGEGRGRAEPFFITIFIPVLFIFSFLLFFPFSNPFSLFLLPLLPFSALFFSFSLPFFFPFSQMFLFFFSSFLFKCEKRELPRTDGGTTRKRTIRRTIRRTRRKRMRGRRRRGHRSRKDGERGKRNNPSYSPKFRKTSKEVKEEEKRRREGRGGK